MCANRVKKIFSILSGTVDVSLEHILSFFVIESARVVESVT